MSILLQNPGQQDQLDAFFQQLLPSTRTEAAAASFKLGTQSSILGVGLEKLQRSAKTELVQPDELNRLYGDLVDVPFSSAMERDDAERIAFIAGRDRKLRSIIGLSPNDILQRGLDIQSRADFGDNIVANFAEAVVNFPVDLLNLVGINPLSSNAVSLGEDLLLTSLAGPLAGKASAGVRALLGGSRIASGLATFAGSSLFIDASVGVAQGIAQSEVQNMNNQEVTRAENLSQAFAGVAFMRGIRMSIDKIKNGGSVVDVERDLVNSTASLEENKSPNVANSIAEAKNIKRSLPKEKNGKFQTLDFDNIKPNDIPNIKFHVSDTGKNTPTFGKYLGKGSYLSSSKSAAAGVSLSGKRLSEVKIFDVKLNENIKILDLNKPLDSNIANKIKPALTSAIDKISKKDTSTPGKAAIIKGEILKAIDGSKTFGEVFDKIKDLDKSLDLVDVDTVKLIDVLSDTIKNQGFDGMRITGGVDHLDSHPDIPKSPHNVLMLFDAEKSSKATEGSKVNPKDINDITDQEIKNGQKDFLSENSDADFDSDMKKAKDTLNDPPKTETPEAATNRMNATMDEDLANIEANLDELPPEIKSIVEEDVKKIKDAKVIEESEQKLIDALIGCGL